jgi:predicted transcriptional regulator
MCDICVEQKDQSKRLAELQSKVLQLLSTKAYSTSDICQALNTNQKLFLKAIQPLLDEGRVTLDKDKKFDISN